LTSNVFIGDKMHYEESKTNDVLFSAFASAVEEMWFLSYVDKLVIMDRSRFGRIGAARASRLNDTYSVRANPKVFKRCTNGPTSVSKLSRLGAGLK